LHSNLLCPLERNTNLDRAISGLRHVQMEGLLLRIAASRGLDAPVSYEVKDMAATALLDIGIDANVRDAAHVLHPGVKLTEFQEFDNSAPHIRICQHLRDTSEEFVVYGDEAAVVLETSSGIHPHILIWLPARQKPCLPALEHELLHQALQMQQLEEVVQHSVIHELGGIAAEVQGVIFRLPEAPPGLQGGCQVPEGRLVEPPGLWWNRRPLRRLGDEQPPFFQPFGDPHAQSAVLGRLAGSLVRMAVKDVVLSPFISGNQADVRPSREILLERIHKSQGEWTPAILPCSIYFWPLVSHSHKLYYFSLNVFCAREFKHWVAVQSRIVAEINFCPCRTRSLWRFCSSPFEVLPNFLSMQ
jgi:hypothetical protein